MRLLVSVKVLARSLLGFLFATLRQLKVVDAVVSLDAVAVAPASAISRGSVPRPPQAS